jgi:hypothetical protein
MAGAKHSPEEKSESPCKYTAIDLQIKIRMICKHKGGQCLSTTWFCGINCEQDHERCCLHRRACERTTMMKLTIIKERKGKIAISDRGKQLTMWMKLQTHRKYYECEY